MNQAVVGVIPAAGWGRRLPGLTGSKEALPLPAGLRTDGREFVIDHLLQRFAVAAIREALVLVRPGKEDIRARLGGGSRLGVRLRYVDVGMTRSIVETMDRAGTEIGERIVALGFPDVLIEPEDSYARLLRCLRQERQDAVLGLFQIDEPERADRVECDPEGAVTSIRVKDPSAGKGYGWMIAIWQSSITDFLGRWWSARSVENSSGELYPGDMLNAAVQAGQKVTAVRFPRGACLDVGTPAGLAAAEQFGTDLSA
jgi:glucose-1-phosphate thymidylyltransferase